MDIGLFEDLVEDGEFKQKYKKVIWIKNKNQNYAFVIYNSCGELVDSVDPIEEIFKIGNRVFVKNDRCTYETSERRLKGLVCFVEQEHFNYERANLDDIEIKI